MRLLVVDDHPLIRVGLRHTLGDLQETELDILEAGTCQDALSMAAENPDLDLVLLDLNLPDASGVAGLDQFSRRFPDLPVLVISSFDDHATMEAVLRRGAAGYIPKTCLNQVLVMAVKLVMAGGVYVPPEILLRPATWAGATIDPHLPVQWPARTAGDLGLTGRQAEVMFLLADGLSNKEIARSLNLAAGTVKTHVGAVLRALNVHTRTQAVLALAGHRGQSGKPR